MGTLWLGSKSCYAIIVGCGRLGAGIARQLEEDGRRVMVIDADKHAFRKLPNDYRGEAITASGTYVDTLIAAGIEQAGMVIAVTDNDNANICIAQMARKMYHTPKVVARVYDNDKAEVLEEMEIDRICPNLRLEDVLDERIEMGE